MRNDCDLTLGIDIGSTTAKIVVVDRGRVRKLHSLRSAAMDMDMAYSKAWTILREAERTDCLTGQRKIAKAFSSALVLAEIRLCGENSGYGRRL